MGWESPKKKKKKSSSKAFKTPLRMSDPWSALSQHWIEKMLYDLFFLAPFSKSKKCHKHFNHQCFFFFFASSFAWKGSWDQASINLSDRKILYWCVDSLHCLEKWSLETGFFFSFRKGANPAVTWSARTWWRTKTRGFALEAFFKDARPVEDVSCRTY